MSLRLVAKLGLVACLCSTIACSDPPAQAVGESTTDADTGSSEGTTLPAGSETTTGDGSDTSTTTAAVDDSGSESGGIVPSGVELLIPAYDAGGNLKYFHYRRDEAGSEGPLQIVPPDGAIYDAATLVPGRRVVFRSNDDGMQELVVGAIDNDDHLHTLTIDPIPTNGLSWLTAIPGADAGIFNSGGDGRVYRVDFPDGMPSAPVVVGTGVNDFYPLPPDLDALGRWTPLPRVTGTTSDVVLARVDAPDPDAPIPVTAVAPMQEAWPRGFNNDGSSLFVGIGEDSRWIEVRHVDLAPNTPGLSTSIHAPLAASEHIVDAWLTPPGRGILYVVEDEDTTISTLWWVGIVDGVPTDPLPLLDGSNFGLQWWSEDGRWVRFRTETTEATQWWLCDTTGGDEATVYPLDAGEYDPMTFSPDGKWIYVASATADGSVLARIALGDRGPGQPGTIAIGTAELAVGGVEDVGADGQRLLVEGGDQGTPLQLLLDLSGPLPATPVVVNRPLAAGDWAQFGKFSPDGSYVVYIERNDVFALERVLVVPTDDPGNAEVVMENALDFIIVE
jgi:hypothetical protein